MKKLIFSMLCISVLGLFSCKKSTDGNKSVISEETETKITNQNGKIDSTTTTSLKKSINGETEESISYTYKGLDGSRAKATYNNSGKAKTLTVEANGKRFELDKISGGIYQRSGIKAVTKGDSLFITQDGNVIPLVLDR